MFLLDLSIIAIIYISDSSPDNSVINRLKADTLERWLEGKMVNRPNGLCIDDEYLYFENSGDQRIRRVNTQTKTMKTIAKVGAGIDGRKLTPK